MPTRHPHHPHHLLHARPCRRQNRQLKMTEINGVERPRPTGDATLADGRISGMRSGKHTPMRLEVGR